MMRDRIEKGSQFLSKHAFAHIEKKEDFDSVILIRIFIIAAMYDLIL